ncbi:hypothetical protein RCO28_10210 [Streptomyces sp. LHD-70]|uniref:hypothetical protein n=1 Tax=Streptomyces sp. LHD-70 TaxID=3072140 RepID=UPI00280E08DD|nr:hypothetical protein [Streptomyces sp. LHD-70]MDQ8702860.1 hypothetical protein [Streptomyces sp. LHD-70]
MAITHRHMRLAAKGLLACLPEFPRPWNVDVLCQELARIGGRPLTLHSVDLPEFPFGMWIDDGRGDRILYRSSATGYHRDHIVLHEICHLLVARERHPAVRRVVPPADGDRPAIALRAADRPAAPAPLLAHSPPEEELAETFASLALKRAGRLRPRDVSAVEQRAAELLGATRA